MCAIVCGIFWPLFLVLFTCSLHPAENVASVDDVMVPLVEADMMVMVNESKRKLGSFQICVLCTCCGGGGRSYCLSFPCCYAINCNIPNKPLGYCSFTPKTCNCFECHL